MLSNDYTINVFGGIESTIFETITRISDTTFNNFVDGFSSVEAGTALIVVIALQGYSIMTGGAQNNIRVFAINFFRALFVYFLCVNEDGWLSDGVAFIRELPDFAVQVTLHGGTESGLSSIGVLDDMLNLVFKRGADIVSVPEFDTRYLLNIVVAFCLLVAGSALTVLGAALIMGAKAFIFVMTGISPIFVFFLMFNASANFFSRYIGFIVFLLFIIILTSVMAELTYSAIETVNINTPEEVELTQLFQQFAGLIITFVFFFLFFYRIEDAARAVTGHFGINLSNSINKGVNRLSKYRSDRAKRNVKKTNETPSNNEISG